MEEYNSKNYTEQGGEVTHINGTLAIGAHGNVGHGNDERQCRRAVERNGHAV